MKIGFVNSIITENENSFPIGLVTLYTILIQKKIPCKLIDFAELFRDKVISDEDFHNCNIERFTELICREGFSQISFYTMANSYHISLLVAQKVKEKQPDCIIIFAGPQATACGYDTLSYFSFIDLIALGEGEKTILTTIIKASQRLFSECPNVLYRENGKIISTPIEPLLENLDELPFLDYSFVPRIKEFSSVAIEVGRGCPFACKFCSTKSFWNQKYRLKSSSRIIKEVIYIQKKYGISEFSFEHDSLTANHKVIRQFCKDLIDSGINIKWTCSSRIDVLDEEIVQLLYLAGCRKIFMGIETGSPTMQKKINKNLKLDNIEPTILLLKKYGFYIVCSFIYGFPDETVEDLTQTLSVIARLIDLKVDKIQLHKLAILRGTEFYNDYHTYLNQLNLESNFNAGGNGNKFDSFVNKYPKVFPQFFNIDGVVNNEIYLESFVNNILLIFSKNFPYTFHLLLKMYSNNLYHFYLETLPSCRSLQEASYKLLNGELSNQSFAQKIEDSLDQNFFKAIWRDDLFLNELFLFERDYLHWFRSSDISFKKEYKYNLYEYIKNNNEEKLDLQKTYITFTKNDGHIYLKAM